MRRRQDNGHSVLRQIKGFAIKNINVNIGLKFNTEKYIND